ncbi:protein singed wings 2 isoform X3 [Nilaparvata lugens]|uniref:protein singed wings 2 isoform X3 n=1 Tax=Nilaparvata lugens TaxID=108931 RepID=UPI00193D6F3F|nr:protein singed wings 2 isoform X3 [Nilaparvata lugens]
MCREKYNGKQVLGVLGMKKVLEATCPVVCTCSIDKVVGNLIPLITVDCSHKGLTEMPKTLPLNTTTLRLQNNKLTDVMPLVNNTDYLNVKDVYLDYNKIASIDVLEGSKWLESFRLLSLRGNYLTQDLILKYESYVKDINDIRCEISENDETSNLLIIFWLLK